MSNSYRDHTKYGYNHFIHRALQSQNKEIPVMTGVGHYIPDTKPPHHELKDQDNIPKPASSHRVCNVHKNTR